MLVNQNVDSYDRQTSEYIVAYIDLLGVTSKIKDADAQNLSMNILHNLYTHTIGIMKEIAIDGLRDVEFKIFSDNIIIAKKLSKTTEERQNDIKCLLMYAAHLQELAASDAAGWMLRGGITIGQLYIDDIVVWGQALLKSYSLENNVAIYPRVIIDNDIVSQIKGTSNEEYLRKDFDNLYFLNYLHNCHFCGRFLEKGFEIMKKDIGTKINDEKMYQKFCWHMNFINSELDRKNEKQDKNYRLKL